MTTTNVKPRLLNIHVLGVPRPQGSMKAHVLPNGKVAMRYPPAVFEWRRTIQQAVAELEESPVHGAVRLRLGFDLPRPIDHFLPVNSKRSVPEVNPSAPAHPTVAPDLDKLVRAICDAITDTGLWRDDSQVVMITAAKRYSSPPGVHIAIEELP